jgi:hypothetical protein
MLLSLCFGQLKCILLHLADYYACYFALFCTAAIELISLALAAAQQLRASELAVRAISELAAQQQLVDSHFITQALSACDGNHAAEVSPGDFKKLMSYAHIARTVIFITIDC